MCLYGDDDWGGGGGHRKIPHKIVCDTLTPETFQYSQEAPTPGETLPFQIHIHVLVQLYIQINIILQRNYFQLRGRIANEGSEISRLPPPTRLDIRLNETILKQQIPECPYVHVSHHAFRVISFKVAALVRVDHAIQTTFHLNALARLGTQMCIPPQPLVSSSNQNAKNDTFMLYKINNHNCCPILIMHVALPKGMLKDRSRTESSPVRMSPYMSIVHTNHKNNHTSHVYCVNVMTYLMELRGTI